MTRSILLGAVLCAAITAPAAGQVAPAAPTPPPAPAEPTRTIEAYAPVAEAPLLALEATAMTLEAPLLAAEAMTLAHEAAMIAPRAPLAALAFPPDPIPTSQDPADSLYRVARETLNRSEYRRAAQLFREFRERYPRSAHVSEASYWEAFSLYRIGTTDDLRTALRVLDQQGRFARKETQANADALQARILGALARRGDAEAQRRVAAAAREGTSTCDTEDLMVRVEALNALSQLDQGAAMPLLRRVLARRDQCSASLRRSAVVLAARRGGPEALPLLTEVASSDPSSSVREVAVSNLARMDTDEAAVALEGMLRSGDANVRRTAARALARRTDARTRRALRAYLESPQTAESHKAEAILNFHKETVATDDVTFLRGLYDRTDSDRVRSAIISVIPRLAPEEGRAWLLGIARNANEPTSARAAAISTLSRDGALPVVELGRMYDAANERRIREHVVAALGRRDEPAATEKLIDIARNGTDPVVRRAAISQLSRKKDPRLAAVLQELIDR